MHENAALFGKICCLGLHGLDIVVLFGKSLVSQKLGTDLMETIISDLIIWTYSLQGWITVKLDLLNTVTVSLLVLVVVSVVL